MTAPAKTILLVEDEIEQSSILAKSFHEKGYSTVVVTTAEEAMHSLAQSLPDLMIVDIKLSDMDGLTFFHTLKEKGITPKVPFIFLTAYNSLQMATTAKREGAADYIVKPYDLDNVVDTVEQILERPR